MNSDQIKNLTYPSRFRCANEELVYLQSILELSGWMSSFSSLPISFSQISTTSIWVKMFARGRIYRALLRVRVSLAAIMAYVATSTSLTHTPAHAIQQTHQKLWMVQDFWLYKELTFLISQAIDIDMIPRCQAEPNPHGKSLQSSLVKCTRTESRPAQWLDGLDACQWK